MLVSLAMLTTQPPVLSHLCDKFNSVAEKEEKRSALALVLHGSLEGRWAVAEAFNSSLL